MRIAVVAWVTGIWLLQRQPQLYSHFSCLGVVVLAALLVWRSRGVHRLACLALLALFAGFSYANLRADWRLTHPLPAAWELQDIQLTGVVDGLVEATPYGPRFVLKVDSVATDQAQVPARLLLSDYAKGAHYLPAQRWQLTVRLKRPHGNLNPGGFDFEAWLLANRIGATGTVRHRNDNQLIQPFAPGFFTSIDRVRQQLATRIDSELAGKPWRGVVKALIMGDQSGIAPEQWQLFRSLGLTHLVSISGLHVTLLATLSGWLVAWLARQSPRLTSRLPARQFGLIAGVATAILYTLLAGAAVPTQRTLWMLMAAALALSCGRRLAVSTVWCFALALTTLIDPWAVLSVGFWLSYLTVGILLYAFAGRVGEPGGWHGKLAAWGGAQWAATLGSAPLLVLYFQQLPVLSPLANAVAIPLIGSLATPIALAGCLDPSGWFWRLAHQILDYTFLAVTWLASWPQAVVSLPSPPVWTLLPASLAVGLWLAPRGLPAKWLAPLGLLPLFALPKPAMQPGEFRLTVLDVGQGLAVLIETGRHQMLFDTGALGGGSRVLPGVLAAAGIRRLDSLMLSHNDSDHVGGAPTVVESVGVDLLTGSLPADHPLRQGRAYRQCEAGQFWQWEGVTFRILHPPAALYTQPVKNDNALSCVLKIDSAAGSVLIPADLEREGELWLLEQSATALRADLLIMPHHGSRTSSIPEFIAAVQPRWAIATAGYLNRFGHPKADIISRYRDKQVEVYRTDLDGAVRIDFRRGGPQITVWREQSPRYWRPAGDSIR